MSTILKTCLSKSAAGSSVSSCASASPSITRTSHGSPTQMKTEERRRIISLVLRERIAEYHQDFSRLADPDEDVVYRLGRLHYPLPRGMRTALSVSFDNRIADIALNLQADDAVKQVQHVLERGKAWEYQPDREM